MFNNNENWNALLEDHEIARLHADVCISSPESYSLDEKRRICEEMDASTRAIDEAMRKDFATLPDFEKKALLDILGAPRPGSASGKGSILLDFDSIPDTQPEI